MKSDQGYRVPQKYLYEKPGRIIPRLPDTLEVPQGMRQDYFGDQQRQLEQMQEHVKILCRFETRNWMRMRIWWHTISKIPCPSWSCLQA